MITNREISIDKALKKTAFLLLFSVSQLSAQDSLLKPKHHEFSTVTIQDSNQNFGINRLKAVDGTAIYDAKKNEVVVLKEMNINLATNASRQIFAKVPGINIWESDASGLQLGIATRGLDPNRTSSFNTRQNGYDMSADALGYPESYYVPPAEAVERIEVVRGAASLQYGPQFGGMLNYVLKRPPVDKKIEWNSYTTVGAYKLVSSFNSLGGTYKGFSYYGLFNYKQGGSWRPNARYKAMTGFASVGYQFSEKLSLRADYTYSHYVAQQAGGLTDAQYLLDARQSGRTRNWFQTNWNILALNFDYKHSPFHQLNVRWWGFIGGRDAVGFLQKPNYNDSIGGKRDLIKDSYKNMGLEARYVWKYFIKEKLSSLLLGTRVYTGRTSKLQGYGSNGSDANFHFAQDSLLMSDYLFPGMNVALFAENSFSVTKKLKIVPGIRYENITTWASGGYRSTANGFIQDATLRNEKRSYSRNFVLLGLGVSYNVRKHTELYANISQNYHGITFDNMRIANTSARVDTNLRDEKGWNLDIGYRGDINRWFSFDASVYWLEYNNRIGQIQQVDSAYNIYQYTTNVGKSRSLGAEVFLQANIFEAAKISKKAGDLVLYVSPSYTHAKYLKSYFSNVVGKYLESAPQFMVRGGITYSYHSFSTTISVNYISKQYSDASNAEFSPTGIVGAIPAYYVLDWNAKYSIKCLQFMAGVNNMTNNIYFTRRATTYPGPGIIPSEPLTFYFTLGIRLNDKVKETRFNTFL